MAARGGSPADPAAPFRNVGFLLSTLGYAAARGFREALSPLELEPRQFAVLRSVGHAEGRSQQALSDTLRIPPSRVVAVLDALEERGLLERRPHPHDRRARALHLTDDGRRLMEEASRLASSYENRLCAGLTPEAREELIATLSGLAAGVGLGPGVHAANLDPAAAAEPTQVSVRS